ncbi:MAG: 3'(2'),5'-bisphosphate nucleotidase CysQ [Sphingomonadaceae bacterium]
MSITSPPTRLADDLARARLLERLAPAVREAGALIERLKAEGSAPERRKADRSVVTDADEAAEALLTAAIRALDPEAPIVGEEASAAGVAGSANGAERFWLIDPLDGTRSYVEGGLDYSVNVGLIEAGQPTVGLVLHPPTTTLWTGAAGLGAWKETGAERTAIRTRPLGAAPKLVTSRSHLDAKTRAWCNAVPDAEIEASGSSLKFCLLAEGLADAYPRFGETSEWDTAAADAILRAAGGITLGPDGAPLGYGKPGGLNGPFLALGDPQAAGRLPPLRV